MLSALVIAMVLLSSYKFLNADSQARQKDEISIGARFVTAVLQLGLTVICLIAAGSFWRPT